MSIKSNFSSVSSLSSAYLAYLVDYVSHLDKTEQVINPPEQTPVINNLDTKNELITLNEHISELPFDMQVEILNKATDIPSYLKFRLLINHPEVIEKHAKAALKAENVSLGIIDRLYETTDEEKYLALLFDKAISKASKSEINKVINLKRNLSSKISKSKRKIETKIENIQEIISFVTTNPRCRQIAGVTLTAVIFFKLKKTLELITDIFIDKCLFYLSKIAYHLNPALAEVVAQKTYQLLNPAYVFYKNHKFLLLAATIFTLYIAEKPTFARYAIIRHTANIIKKIFNLIIFVPVLIIRSSFKASIWFSKTYLRTSFLAGVILKSIKDRKEKQRINYELKEARDIWIHYIKNRKTGVQENSKQVASTA